MAKIKRIYNVPLRKGFRRVVRYRKTKKAVVTLRKFIQKHMKCEPENVKIGPKLNLKLWERGIRNPPHHVKVTAVKEDDIVKVELFGFKYPETEETKQEKPKKKEEEKTEKKKPKVEKKEEKKTEKKKETKKKTEKKKTTKKKSSKKKTAKK